jgi:hypothetical protein
MMNTTTRAIIGFTVAPFVPACLYWTYLCVLSQPHTYHTDFLWESVTVIFSLSVMVTLPITLAIGLPAYALIRKHSTLRREHVLGISGAGGAVVGLLAGAPFAGALLGLSAGFTFWLIWHRDRDEPTPF